MSLGRRPVPLVFAISQDRDATVLAIKGEIDLATVAPFHDLLRWILEDWLIARLVVDLADVTFLDARGVATLASGRQLADVRNVDFSVVNCWRTVRRVLEITGVDKMLRVDGDGIGLAAGDVSY